MNVALVNTNRIVPPIAPIGLDYVAEALHAGGHSVAVLDLCWEPDAAAAMARFFDRASFGLVGVTLRNTDDCDFFQRQSFVPELVQTVARIQSHTDAPVVLGGVGFSVIPEEILALSGAAAGVWGEGEFAIAELASRIDKQREWRDLPGLVWRAADGWRRNPAAARPLADLPSMSRTWVDNRRYFREGGQAGFETKRGCAGECVYCADPVAKGTRTRTRPPEAVVDELERLLEQGIDRLHTCDGEFNLPAWHALEVCREIARRGLGGKLRWYAYCSPAPFSRELAGAMREAGCVGIDFGADHGDAEMLGRLGRGFGPDDVVNATRLAKEAGMAVMLDLLLGAPGESTRSVTRAIELMNRAGPDLVGMSVGVRVFAGTALARRLKSAGEVSVPQFFLEPDIAPSIFGLLDTLIGDDRRFLFFDPSRPDRNYNYNANQRLVDAIGKGYRGAFWDILRRYE